MRADVGQYLNRHFVSSFQKVGTFRLINGLVKVGGNVASYFCTPDGQVLHALAGPVDGVAFLHEARWANETYQLAQLEAPAPEALRAFFRKAHLERLRHEQRLRHEHNLTIPTDRLVPPVVVSAKYFEDLLLANQHLHLTNRGKMHLLLAVGAMPRLDQFYQVVFERVLNEEITTRPVGTR